MKKRIMILVSLIFIIIDILVGISYWKNYGYYLSNVDKVALVEFFCICILVGMIVFVTNIIKGYGYTMVKVLISISLVLMIFVSTYQYYNQTIHYDLEVEDIESITINIAIEELRYEEFIPSIIKRKLNKEEIERFVDNFKKAKYIKMNSDKKDSVELVNNIEVVLSDGSKILLSNYRDRIAVRIVTKNDKESCYWMVQEEITKTLFRGN